MIRPELVLLRGHFADDSSSDSDGDSSSDASVKESFLLLRLREELAEALVAEDVFIVAAFPGLEEGALEHFFDMTGTASKRT